MVLSSPSCCISHSIIIGQVTFLMYYSYDLGIINFWLATHHQCVLPDMFIFCLTDPDFFLFTSPALDFIESLLTFDPRSRLSAAEALQHPYFSRYACDNDEPIADRPFHIEHEVSFIASFDPICFSYEINLHTAWYGLWEIVDIISYELWGISKFGCFGVFFFRLMIFQCQHYKMR